MENWSDCTHYEDSEVGGPELEKMTSAAGDRARQADFNLHKNRCLIENSDASNTVLTNLIPRLDKDFEDIMNRLEWAWGMTRGSLNLDTRRNLVVVSPIMQHLLLMGQWSLLPEERVLRQYFTDSTMTRPYSRCSFPKLEDETYQYTFIPLFDMEDIYIPRQEEDGSVIVHHYPYPNFPVLTSHVHPTFAIIQLAVALTTMEDEVKLAQLLEQNISLRYVMKLYEKWTSPTISEKVGVPRSMCKFWRSGKHVTLRRDNGPDTPPRRILFQQPKIERQAPHSAVGLQTRLRRKQIPNPITFDALDRHDEEVSDEELEEWLGIRLSSWVNDSFAYPALPTSALLQE
ncbi:hypothetical protein CVT24_002357 [Panaeolus cyanescens]|uniref:HNH nuclease domain-containing protein n=1 Tax=Panaeolus cyanescens TaxID=181874 RepID=A0A409W127_9AGAR|nr:hypothetical protein CVT24_002357 [Panaeolus cyanescens]